MNDTNTALAIRYDTQSIPGFESLSKGSKLSGQVKPLRHTPPVSNFSDSTTRSVQEAITMVPHTYTTLPGRFVYELFSSHLFDTLIVRFD